MRMGSHRCYLPCDQNSRSKGILVFMTCNNTGTAAQSQLSVTHCPQVVRQGSAALRLVALFTPSTLLLISVLNQHGFKCFTFPLRAMLPSHDTRDLGWWKVTKPAPLLKCLQLANQAALCLPYIIAQGRVIK